MYFIVKLKNKEEKENWKKKKEKLQTGIPGTQMTTGTQGI